MSDLNNRTSYENLGEMISAYWKKEAQKEALSKAIADKKAEIAERFVNILCGEELPPEDALSIVELVQDFILKSNLDTTFKIDNPNYSGEKLAKAVDEMLANEKAYAESQKKGG